MRADRFRFEPPLAATALSAKSTGKYRSRLSKAKDKLPGQKADRSGSGRVSLSAPCAELRRVRPKEIKLTVC